MARLLTAGAETLGAIGDDKTMEGAITSSGTVTVDTGTVKTGAKSFKCDSAAGAVAAYVQKSFTGASLVTYYARAWINTTATVTAARNIVTFLTTGSTVRSVVLNTNGTASLLSGTHSAVINDGTWHCIELELMINTAGGSDDTRGCWVDGTLVERASGVAIGTTAPNQARFGWSGTIDASQVLYVDDLALNDDTGGNQNTNPGLGRIVLLLPTADSAIGTGWTLGSGGTSNLFGGVDNVPPAGVADAGATAQIRNAASAANSNYDATMETYATEGIASGDTVNLIQPYVWTAAPVTTSAKLGTVGVVSNPTITNVNLAAGGTASAFWSGVAGGTFPTGWKLSPGTLTYAPSVTVGTAPVMRITQVTSSTRIAMVCFLGMIVDYTAASAAATSAPPRFTQHFFQRAPHLRM